MKRKEEQDNVKKYVEKTLNIFEISKSEKRSVKKIILKESGDYFICKISFFRKGTFFALEEELNSESSFIALRDHEKTKKAMQELNELKMSRKMVIPMYKYFSKNLDKYFIITIGEKEICIVKK